MLASHQRPGSARRRRDDRPPDHCMREFGKPCWRRSRPRRAPRSVDFDDPLRRRSPVDDQQGRRAASATGSRTPRHPCCGRISASTTGSRGTRAQWSSARADRGWAGGRNGRARGTRSKTGYARTIEPSVTCRHRGGAVVSVPARVGDVLDPERLVGIAEAAVDRAKQHGRNRVGASTA